MIQGVELSSQSPLFEVVETDGAFDALASFLKARQCQCAKDGNDRYDHQQFHQRECCDTMSFFKPLIHVACFASHASRRVL